MSRPSPRSRRRGRSRPGHTRIAPAAAVRELLAGDWPEVVKRKIFLAVCGGVHGRRECLLCGRDGFATRIHIPAEALRPGDPDLAGVRAYWVCAVHSTLEPEDEQVVEALSGKAKQVEAQRGERGVAP